ncbi:MAG TPA: hypothetical protein VFK11_04955 [Candidatus Saccharimonadales bacterium]|nr:hypothetical protein [Candidatus Saccharimonadales bacterium]
MHFDKYGNLILEKAEAGDFERARTIDQALNPKGGLRKGSPGVKGWEANSVGRAMIDAGLTPRREDLGGHFKKIPLPGRVETFIVLGKLTNTKRGDLVIRHDEIDEVRQALDSSEIQDRSPGLLEISPQELLTEIDEMVQAETA